MDMDDKPEGPRPISQSLRGLIESSKGCALSTDLAAKTDPYTAVARAKVLAGCYRKDDAADPETYAAAISAILTEYPEDIVMRVTDPRSGLPARLQWLPSVKEVRDACEEIAERRRQAELAAAREQAQLRERREWIAKREHRPTIDELKAKHGENWGLTPDDAEVASQEKRRQMIQRANDTLLRREYENAGMEPIEAAPGIPISKYLYDQIKARADE